jgi:hypothetical protein
VINFDQFLEIARRTLRREVSSAFTMKKLTKGVSVADILERELQPTIKEWLRRVNLVPELTGIPLSDEDRTRTCPSFTKT